MFYPNEKIALFIDGSNLHATIRAVDLDVDYKSLLDHFSNQAQLLRAFYYTAIMDEHEFSPIKPLTDWLVYNGFTLVTKPTKKFVDDEGREKIKGNMDIEIAVDMMAMSDHIEHAVLFSGDGDFRRLVEAVQRRGVRVTVVSSLQSRPQMIADELRRQADAFIDICDLREHITRDRSHDDSEN